MFVLHAFLYSETLQGAKAWEETLEDLVREMSQLTKNSSQRLQRNQLSPSLRRFLDTSKQAIGMLFIHFANVYLSDLTEEDPCSLWVHLVFDSTELLTADFFTSLTLVSPRYLINFLLDASLGMLLIYAGVRAVSAIVEWRQWESLRFGEYGEDRVWEEKWDLQHISKISAVPHGELLLILVLWCSSVIYDIAPKTVCITEWSSKIW